MGQVLSCTKKQKEPTDASDISSPIKGKKWKIKKEVTAKTEVHEYVTATGNTALLSASPNHADASVPVQLRDNFCLLKPAPAKCPLPNRLSAKSSPRKSGDIWPSLDSTMCAEPLKLNTSDYLSSHKPEPVDQLARDLAQGNAKPATWADLYWALIGQRHLKSDLERVRAIFSWLCSLPMGENAFATKRELEKAVEMKIEHAAEALKNKAKEPASDSPEIIVNELTQGTSTYLRAFESLCRYTGLPCYTIKGLAKGVDYTVGMSLTEPTPQSTDTLKKSGTQYSDDSPLARLQHAWSAVFVDGRWALFDAMWATERLAVNGNRTSQVSQKTAQVDTDTDMFYFNADPGKFIYSHYPFDPHWQLLNPPMTLKQFQDSVLLKPSFFTYGLGLLSHQDGVISIHSKLIIKLSLPSDLANQVLFTFNLKADGKNPILEGVNLSRFGIHEISRSESTVTFSFRFPKAGRYKVTIYARRIGDHLFTDACEYRVDATGTETATVTDKPSESSIDMPPFPPTAQSQYGPTEKAAELGLRPVGHDDCQRRCKNGVFEIRFTNADPTGKLPRVTARLKSLLHDPSMLIDCLLVRSTEGMLPSTLGSLASRGSTALGVTGPMVPMVVVTAYLPTAGEYALEVYAAPAEADDSVSYFLVWQFMIDAEVGVALASPVRRRLATCNLGAQDTSILEKTGIKMISHPDPLIHVPTAGSLGMVKTRSKGELMQQFMETMQKRQKTLEAVSEADAEGNPPGDEVKPTEGKPLIEEEVQDPRSCDLTIVLEQCTNKQMNVIGQLVDISETEEEDRTTYLLQQVENADLPELASGPNTKRISFLIRIPKGDHFYKLYLYAPIDETSIGSVFLVYTYVIEAPSRLMSFEVPYIGVKWGAFPEKLKEHEQQANNEVAAAK